MPKESTQAGNATAIHKAVKVRTHKFIGNSSHTVTGDQALSSGQRICQQSAVLQFYDPLSVSLMSSSQCLLGPSLARGSVTLHQVGSLLWDSDPQNRDRMCGILSHQGGIAYVGFTPTKLGSIVWDGTISVRSTIPQLKVPYIFCSQKRDYALLQFSRREFQDSPAH